MNFKEGDIVVVLEDEKNSAEIYLKAGEVCKVRGIHSTLKHRIKLQSLNPSYKNGIWFTDIDNIEFAPEMLQVLS
jgi:hypothetical protein